MTAPATKTPPSPTPRLPIRAEKRSDGGCELRDPDGRTLAFDVTPEDAPRIVLAVNEHEALVGIVRDVETWGCEDCGRSAPSKCDWCKRVRAILSRIEGAR